MFILAVAFTWDLLLGEPPSRLHPVVGLGKVIESLCRSAPSGPAWQFVWGGGVTCALVAAAAIIGWALEALARPWGFPLEVFLLTSSFAVRELVNSGARVGAALEVGGVDEARKCLSEIVSRDVRKLDGPRIASGAVQSVSENLADSVVAPLFWFALLGLPGALAYRTANTLDAMIGYHGRYEHLGKFAARLDDVLSWIPARIAALVLLVLGTMTGRLGWATWWRDRRAPPSPNGGHPMAAAAGVLGVTLEKVEHYRLGHGPAPGPEHIILINRYALAAAALVAVAAGLARIALTGQLG